MYLCRVAKICGCVESQDNRINNNIQDIMIKKMLKLFLLGTPILLASCIDDTYDLANKELVTDVQIKGNKLALPLGSFRAFMLDSLINADGMSFLDFTDGTYSISMSDSLSFDVDIDPIKLSIPTQKHSTKIDFIDVDITEMDIEGTNAEPATFGVPNISLEDLNANLPNLSSSVSTSLVTDEMKAIFETIKSGVPLYFAPTYKFQSLSFGLSDAVACDMSYTLPEQIKNISTILLANRSEGKNATTGSLIQFNVRHPEVLSKVTKTISFNVEFPESFNLSLDKSAQGFNKYTLVNAHTLKVEGLTAEGNVTAIQFYIDELNGLEQYINSTTGTLSMNEEIKYEVEYKLDGEVTLSSSTNLEDFEFSVDMNLPLGFRDVEGETNDIYVDFEPVLMDFQAHFDNLQYVERIDSIVFDARNSILSFDTDMSGGFSPFLLKEGHALKLDFPEEFVIDETLSVYPTKGDAQPKVVYNPAERAFYIYDLEVFAQSHWELALDRIVLNKPVVNGVLDLDVKALIAAVDAQNKEVDNLVLAGVKLESLSETLESLKQKQATFAMSKSHLSVKDAVLRTEKIVAPLDTKASFALNEVVPQEIGRIESIGFTKDVPVCIEMKMSGLEKLDAEVNLDLSVALPSFLKLKSTNSNVIVDGGKLLVKADYLSKQEKPLSIELLCTGLDFMGAEFGNNGLQPKDSTNGKSYLSYTGEINVVGEACINGMDFHSDVLKDMDDISVDLKISMGDIEVKNFSGLYRGEIGKIEESFELNLGDGFGSFMGEDNRIKLASPQITIAFDNPIAVPVDIDLHLFGKDENGNIIESSSISQVLHIAAGEFDPATGNITPGKTKLFITSDTNRVSKQGYQNVEIPNLSRLLENVPSSIDFAVLPIVKQDVSHHIDLSQALKFSGEYSVVIPLKFDEFHVCYSDTIPDLQVSLGEAMDMFSNIAMGIKMNVNNTIPVGFSLSVNALDKDDREIEDITIEDLRVAAGNGGSILNSDEVQSVKFGVKSGSGDLSALDKLAFSIEAWVDETVGGVAFAKEQGIQISNIVIEVSGDIETNMTKK